MLSLGLKITDRNDFFFPGTLPEDHWDCFSLVYPNSGEFCNKCNNNKAKTNTEID